VPRLWNTTIAVHRRAVHDAVLNTAAALAAKHGLMLVTMSGIAGKTGIGRATLYKYFPNVESILLAWHERQIAGHLEYLAEIRDKAGNAAERLEAVFQAYALISHARRGHHGGELAAFLHKDKQVARARRKVHGMFRSLLIAAAKAGFVRSDIAPGELASYCLHALDAAGSLPSSAAARRLVAITLAGLRPAGGPQFRQRQRPSPPPRQL